MEKLQGELLPPGSIRLDLIRAPLFVEPHRPLFLSYFMAPSHKFRGMLGDRKVRIVAVGRDGAERVVREITAAFVGGDNWQRTVELAPEDFRGARTILARLLDGDRHFLRLALAHTDAAITVANHGQCGKTENPAALHNLGHAVDRNHLFAQAVVAFVSLNFRLHLCHDEFFP